MGTQAYYSILPIVLNCGEDAFYIFDNTEEAIDEFLNQR